MSWSLNTTCTSDPLTYNQKYRNEKQIKTCALSPGEYTLICSDSFGDGWGDGQLTIQGVTYCDDFTEGSEMTTQVTITGSWRQASEANRSIGKIVLHNLKGMTNQNYVKGV